MGRHFALLVFVFLATTPSASAQAAARQRSPRAFDPAVIVGGALTFNGRRAEQTATDGTGSVTVYSVGSAPVGRVELQFPLVSTFGVLVGGSIGRPSRVRCGGGIGCQAGGRSTMVRGVAALLLRLKARVPVFFGAGPAVVRFDPGPIPGQGPTTEMGGAFIIGYDFAPARGVGARVAVWNYFTQPSDAELGPDTEARGFAHAFEFSLGVRIRLF